MTTLRKASDIVDGLLKSPDGATVPVIAGQRVPASGYVVGQAGISGQLDSLDVHGWVDSVLPAAAFTPGTYLGIWTDSETGTVYLDVVRVFAELVPACLNAEKRGELAVWDLANQAEIRAADYVIA